MMKAQSELTAAAPEGRDDKTTWIKRIGILGFLFFLIKGLLWILIPAGLILWRRWTGE